MDMLIVPIPLFNKDMAVEVYYFRYQKGNDYITTALQSTAVFDGATMPPPLETLNTVGVEAFTIDQPVIVPVGGIALLGDLDSQCDVSPDKVIFLLNADAKPEEPYISNMQLLREKGYRFAFHNVYQLVQYKPLLDLGDYIFLNTAKLEPDAFEELLRVLNRDHRNLKIVATHIASQEDFDRCKRKQIHLFEGNFYRVPVTKGRSDVSPLKTNLIRLLNIVRDENFEFDMVSDIVQKDTALSVSLMRMVNSPFLGLSQKINTINHAITILGQNEVRKWVTTSVSRSLGSDRPNEISRLSLVRAKFAENLAPLFKLQRESQSLFLTGLFSVLDVILEMDMADALKLVLVSDDIHAALVERTGKYATVLSFIENYETADWGAISRELIIHDLSTEDIYDAYIEAVSWYTDLIGDVPAAEGEA
ncbi:HDOD domain-containing protein [Ruminococcaceae bacterium OttesenSCG-928-L11]|nr:HDOD domain-containing protein [Ruminococcaceae bacterium OttesenSCG-928-L11]